MIATHVERSTKALILAIGRYRRGHESLKFSGDGFICFLQSRDALDVCICELQPKGWRRGHLLREDRIGDIIILTRHIE
jgi:hypothetical protein